MQKNKPIQTYFQMKEKSKFNAFLLSIIWWSLLLIVNPIGDFPLNDDWAYAHNVKALVIDHEIYFSDWPAMTLIAHTLWGALFCQIFGFSFTVLRFSTLILGWIGLLATYNFFKEGHFSKKHAFWCTLIIGFNPLYFCLSYSYMTDVPFFTFMILASLYFIKTLNGKGDYNIIIATLFSIIAVLIRQVGILMPLTFLFVFLLQKKITLKTILRGFTPLLVSYGIMSFFINWREVNYGLSKNFGDFSTLINTITWEKIQFLTETLTPIYFSYWGFFLLPLIALNFSLFLKSSSRKVLLGSFFLTFVFLFFYGEAWDKNIMGNVIYNIGLGPRVEPNISDSLPYSLSTNTWQRIKAFTFFSGVMLVFTFSIQFFKLLQFYFSKNIFSYLKHFPFSPIKCYAIFAASIYFGFLVFNNNYFDRYHLPLLPFFIIVIFPQKKIREYSKLVLGISSLLFLVQIFYSVGSTRDYLTYNRVKWHLIHKNITQKQIPINHIAGGFEFNSWYKKGISQPKEWHQKEWWFKNEKYYLADFGGSCSFTPIDSVIYQQVFPPRKDTVYFSERKEVTFDKIITCGAEVITTDSLSFVTNDSTILLQNTDTQNSDKAHDGKYASKLDGKKQYAFTLKLDNIQPCERIWVEVWRYPVHSPGAIVLSANNPKEFYESENSWVFKKDDSGWGLLSTGITIPKDFKDDIINFYLFNPSKEEVWFDDLIITRVKH